MGLGDVLPFPFSAKRRALRIHCSSSIIDTVLFYKSEIPISKSLPAGRQAKQIPPRCHCERSPAPHGVQGEVKQSHWIATSLRSSQRPPSLLDSGLSHLNFGHSILFRNSPACATYLRPPKRGLRVGGSRFGEGRDFVLRDYFFLASSFFLFPRRSFNSSMNSWVSLN